MFGLMESLDFVCVYIDDLLTITKGNFEDHLDKLRQVLVRLQKANLGVNAAKSSFAQEQVEYLGYTSPGKGLNPFLGR